MLQVLSSSACFFQKECMLGWTDGWMNQCLMDGWIIFIRIRPQNIVAYLGYEPIDDRMEYVRVGDSLSQSQELAAAS